MFFRFIRLFAFWTVTLFFVQLLNLLLDGNLSQFGIRPRDFDSIWTIYSAPFIHDGWAHLLNNFGALLLLSALVYLSSPRAYVFLCLFVVTLGGLLVWIFARGAIHVGSSGLVFGLWGFLLAIAWFDRSIKNLLVALLVIFLYGSMIYGVFPIHNGMSFESHFFGACTGVFFAYLANRYRWSSTSKGKATPIL